MLENYYSLFLVVGILLLYISTFILYLTGKIKLITHRKIWNIILSFSFLISGILGVILAILLDQKIIVSWYSEFLWLHVEFGIVMAIVAIFHASWHWKYYSVLLKKIKHEK